MAGFALRLDGLDNLTKRLKSIEDDLTRGVASEIAASALRIEKDAKRNAPVNMGTLRRSIHTVSNLNGLTSSVIVGASYGAYLEFGTGGKVSIPSGYESYAAQFKGQSGGTMAQFIDALTDWVKKKGLAGTYSVKSQNRLGSKSVKYSQDEKLARFLAFKILKKGIRAQAFLIPAYEVEKPKLYEKLKKMLNAKR